MVIIKGDNGQIIASNVHIADRFFSRLKGLMFTKSLPKNSALVINPCNSIHMFFMNYSLDVVFVDKNDIVLDVIVNIKPWHISKIVLSSQYVIELPAKSTLESNIKKGDILTFFKTE